MRDIALQKLVLTLIVHRTTSLSEPGGWPVSLNL